MTPFEYNSQRSLFWSPKYKGGPPCHSFIAFITSFFFFNAFFSFKSELHQGKQRSCLFCSQNTQSWHINSINVCWIWMNGLVSHQYSFHISYHPFTCLVLQQKRWLLLTSLFNPSLAKPLLGPVMWFLAYLASFLSCQLLSDLLVLSGDAPSGYSCQYKCLVCFSVTTLLRKYHVYMPTFPDCRYHNFPPHCFYIFSP